MFDTWLPLFGGLMLLIAGGELLVRGAVLTAERLGISPLVIGLTLVGFGTSMPELVTSVQAGLGGFPGIAYGNIVGSNIANILLIAGIAALVCPVVVSPAVLRRDVPVMLAVAAGFAVLAWLMPLDRIVGLGLLGLLVAYLWFVIRQDRAGGETTAGAATDAGSVPGPGGALRRIGGPLVLALTGLGVVVIGGALLVSGAVAIARDFGVSETVIGLTIVAVGTSMPELVTSVIAGLKRQGDVALGNVVGSNIYNILGIGGATALIAPSGVPAQIVAFDAPVMVAVSVLLVLFAATGLRIGRREGAVLFAGYVAYLWVLWP